MVSALCRLVRGCAALVVMVAVAGVAGAQPTAITYQGLIESKGERAAGPVDLRVRLYDALVGGAQHGPQLSFDAVTLTDGTFTLAMDFGVSPYVPNADRWLEIDVRTVGEASFTTLAPRQALTAVPFAMNTRGIFVDEQGQVGVATSAPNAMLHVKGSFHAGGLSVPDASNPTGEQVRDPGSMWQSFTAEHNGELRTITFKTLSQTAWTGTLRVHEGVGIGGVLLTPAIAMSGPGSATAQSVTVTIPAGVQLSLGGVYTFVVAGSGTFTPIIATSNPYLGGQASIGTNIDMYFLTTVGPVGAYVTTEGRLGVGTLTPSAELDVRGNIRLGVQGTLDAVAAEEPLRIVRGKVTSNGAVGVGAGFTVSTLFPGQYVITFTKPYPSGGEPTVVATPESERFIRLISVTPTGFSVQVTTVAGQTFPSTFSFIAAGPR